MLDNGVSEDDDPHAETRQAWTSLCEAHGVSLAAAAIAFAGLPTIVEKVVMGFSRPEEVEPTLAAARESETVPRTLWRAAKDAGLLHPDLDLG
jgi:D-threo-aldose 1-dehydrogenase